MEKQNFKELTVLAEQFKTLCKTGKWQEAKNIYDIACKKAVELTIEEKIILFGNRPYRDNSHYSDEAEVEGLFCERLVMLMREMCIFGKRITK